MANSEWVSLCYDAAARLQNLWGIPLIIAEQTVRNVVLSGKVAVRGMPRHQLVYRIITEEIRPILFENSLFATGYENIEIDWNGLVLHGRELLPSWIQVIGPPTGRKRLSDGRGGSNAKARRAKSGPERGTTGFRSQDRKLFLRISDLMTAGQARSAHDAALILAKGGEIAGAGTPENKAKRVSVLFLRERGTMDR
jgi:hypothetical protein